MFAVTITASPVGLFFAFLGGVVSILSPCVLPILPGLLAMVSGTTLPEMEKEKNLGRKILTLCGLFSIGFSFVYIVIGLSTTQLSQTFSTNSQVATRIGGVLIIVFALVLLLGQLNKFRVFSLEKRPLLKSGVTDAGAVITGAAFAFGWSPCIGPILGGVLAYASTEHSIVARIAIILSYCIGLCVAMTSIAYSYFKFQNVSKFLKRHLGLFQWISILIMLFFGVVLAFNKLNWITAELTDFMDFVGLDSIINI